MEAIPYALALADSVDAEVTLVSAVDPLATLSVAGDVGAGVALHGMATQQPALGEMLTAARSGRERLLSKAAGEVRQTTAIQVRYEVLEGEPSEAVATYVQGTRAELVVMATHGRGGFERAWLGSVADRLVRRLDVPLLLVRPSADGDGTREESGPQPVIRRILVPLDGSALAEAALDPATAAAQRLDAAVILLRVVDPDLEVGLPYPPDFANQRDTSPAEVRSRARDYLARVKDRLVAEGVHVHGVELRDGSAATAILDMAGAEADMVVMATHGRGGVRRWLLGSVSDKVLRRGNVPLLLVRPDNGGEDE
jgi:nucleotide-binding universal stress UspA family protein